MQRQKKKRFQPWLTSTGVEIPTEELRTISQSWDQEIWNAYLSWYQSPRREALVAPGVYNKKGEEMVQSIFEENNQEVSSEKQALCEQLLSLLPAMEATVLRLKFFEGRTDREIAALRKISKSGVHDIKNRALSRLLTGTSRERFGHPPIYEGAKFQDRSCANASLGSALRLSNPGGQSVRPQKS